MFDITTVRRVDCLMKSFRFLKVGLPKPVNLGNDTELSEPSEDLFYSFHNSSRSNGWNMQRSLSVNCVSPERTKL